MVYALGKVTSAYGMQLGNISTRQKITLSQFVIGTQKYDLQQRNISTR